MKVFDKKEFSKLLLILTIVIYLSYLIFTKKIYYLISPHMIKFTIFSICGFISFLLFQSSKLFSYNRNNYYDYKTLILTIPILLCFFTPLSLSSSYLVDNKAVNLNVKVSNKTDKDIDEDYNIINHMDNVLINDNNFYRKTLDIGDKIDNYKGKKITISGFVFKDKNTPENKFVIARMVMICCAADAQVVGLFVESNDNFPVNNGDWIKIDGIISSTEFKDTGDNKTYLLPLINIKNITKIQKPSNQYIYPN